MDRKGRNPDSGRHHDAGGGGREGGAARGWVSSSHTVTLLAWLAMGPMQRAVLELALRVLAGAGAPGSRVDLDVEWPVPLRDAYRAGQPKEASPIVKVLLETGKRPG